MSTVITLPVETTLGWVGPWVCVVTCSRVLKYSFTIDKLFADWIRTYVLKSHNDWAWVILYKLFRLQKWSFAKVVLPSDRLILATGRVQEVIVHGWLRGVFIVAIFIFTLALSRWWFIFVICLRCCPLVHFVDIVELGLSRAPHGRSFGPASELLRHFKELLLLAVCMYFWQ